jgi:hypothetical protein
MTINPALVIALRDRRKNPEPRKRTTLTVPQWYRDLRARG